MSLDADLDRLYQLPPGEFIGERNALAKRAGARGAEIRALPKPTVGVWAVNQVHWRKPDIYRSLIESAENLRATHKAVLAGHRGDLRAAGKAHEAALDAALKAALAAVVDAGHPATDATRQMIATTLRALPAGDPPGRLRQALAPGGFEMLTGLPSGGRVLRPPADKLQKSAARKTDAPRLATQGRAAVRTDKAPVQAKPDKAAVAQARKALASAARTLASAEQAARREEFEAARAARDAEKAERRVARAEEAVAAAQAELQEAEREAAAAVKKRDAARGRAAAAERTRAAVRARSDAAQHELDELG